MGTLIVTLLRALLLLVVGLPVLVLGCAFVMLALPLCVLSIPVLAAILLVRLLRSGTQTTRRVSTEEIEFMQGFHATLTRLEERVEALETVLLSRPRT